MVNPESPKFTGPHIPGTYYFVLTAFDTEGYESGPSNESTLIVVNDAPSPPGGCSIIKF